MDLQTLQENVQGFAHPEYGRVQRDGAAFVATERFVRRGLTICLTVYRRLQRLDQTAALLRYFMDHLLRKYHDYAIKDQFRAHYRDADLSVTDKTDFEHVIPVAVLMALLIHNKITVELAMNPPTCLIKKRHHKLLKSQGLDNKTPDTWWFWKRYARLGIRLETHTGDPVDPAVWNLGTHVTHFSIKDHV